MNLALVNVSVVQMEMSLTPLPHYFPFHISHFPFPISARVTPARIYERMFARVRTELLR
jgi:hypothetical protein